MALYKYSREKMERMLVVSKRFRRTFQVVALLTLISIFLILPSMLERSPGVREWLEAMGIVVFGLTAFNCNLSPKPAAGDRSRRPCDKESLSLPRKHIFRDKIELRLGNVPSFAPFVIFGISTFAGCGRTYDLPHPVAPIAIKNATKAELVSDIDINAAKIQTLYAALRIDTSAGVEKKRKVTDYKQEQLEAYVWVRKPAMLRIQGTLPNIRTGVFDMVSDGLEFKLWIPSKNQFVVGHNTIAGPGPQGRLEDLRPQIIYDALLVSEIDKADIAIFSKGGETIVGEKGRTYEQPDYIIDIMRGQWPSLSLSRKIVISSVDLLPNRQLFYDDSGHVVADVHYSNYKDFNTVRLPSRIEIQQPEENLDVTLSVMNMDINQALADDKFVLDQPQGVQVIDLDHTGPVP